MSIAFTQYHGLAKYLLNEYCSNYSKELLSPVSSASLKTQVNNVTRQLKSLEDKSDQEVANFLMKIIFVRLIDDLSKVPKPMAEKKRGGQVTYFNEATIQTMLVQQMQSNLQKGIAAETLEDQLDKALTLLGRAWQFSNHICSQKLIHGSLILYVRRNFPLKINNTILMRES